MSHTGKVKSTLGPDLLGMIDSIWRGYIPQSREPHTLCPLDASGAGCISGVQRLCKCVARPRQHDIGVVCHRGHSTNITMSTYVLCSYSTPFNSPRIIRHELWESLAAYHPLHSSSIHRSLTQNSIVARQDCPMHGTSMDSCVYTDIAMQLLQTGWNGKVFI